MAEHDEDPLQRIEDELRASRARLTGRSLPDPTLFGAGEAAFEETWPEIEADAEAPFLGMDDHPTVDLQADVEVEVEVTVEVTAEGPAAEPTSAPIVDIPVLSDPEDFVVEIPPAGPLLRAAGLDLPEPEPTEPLLLAFDDTPVGATFEPAFEAVVGIEPEIDGPVPAPFVLEIPEEPLAPEPVVVAAEPLARPQATDATTEVLAQIAALGRRLTEGLDDLATRQARLESMFLTRGATTPAPAAAPVGSAPSEMEEWSMALARLVRADSEALRAEVQRMAAEQREALAALDQLREADVRVLNQRIDESMLRIDNAVFRLGDSIERRLSSAIDSLEYAAQMTRQADRQALLASVEDRVEALARLIRSDHEHLAATVAAEQEASKQALRSAKEVQAALPREIADAIDRRLAGFARTLT